MTPAFKILADGVDATGNFNDRLLQLTVTDNEGLKSDSCEIEVDDRDGKLAIPRKGTKLSVSMGYKETGLHFMGLYTVDEVEVSGFPRKMRISASAADLREKLKSQHNKGFEKKKLGDIVGEVAKRNGLSPMVSDSLKNFEYDYLGQTEESDLHLLTRIAEEHDALAAIKNGKILFMKRGEGKQGSVTIQGYEVLQYSAKFADKPLHDKSKADWWDKDQVKRVTEEEPVEGAEQ